ncbi:Na/Pi cotransporter family protein [uncultured Thiodictyon sp.]|uniref:Na/Pi cotransporter family protein n=1 Tax=uncultured Thiodictyon sp. TaxID=1846217 RepID=UPI0025DD4C8A|nr:Na/Pi cotransporter family protein [uncultured Thiodictyon sp.]
MTIELLGGLALFLYGMEKMTDGLKAAAGKQMNTLLAKLTGNPVLGAITGAIVTAVIQSSSVTTVLVVGFVSAGLMTLVQSVGVIFGANVGTTVTAQIVAFNTTALAYPLIAIGFLMASVWKQGVARHYGAMLMGLGLIFYGMAVMGSAMSPLRTHEGFAQLLQSLQNPVLGMLAGAAFTALVQSSSATIGLAVVMATQGLLSLPAGIAILFGAKIGTGITAILAAIGKPQDAKRAAAVHVLFNVLGAVIWLPFIAQLAGFAEMVSPVAAHLQGVERLAEEVPRQIANAATIWATANTLIFLPFAALFAKMASKLIPDRAVDERAIIRPRYLDDTLIRLPAMALERARLELGHMGELTEAMLAKVKSAFETGDLSELSQQYDQVVVLREAVLTYLQHVGRGELSDLEADEHARLVAATGDIENMGAAISRELAPLARTLKEADIAPSQETAELLKRLFKRIQESAHAALRAVLEGDERAAQTVVANRNAILELTAELHRQQAARLAQDDPNRLLKHRVQIEILDKLRRIYSVAEDMAISVLPRSVLVGELTV